MALFGTNSFESPFYRNVNGDVKAELRKRASAYSRKVRSGGSNSTYLNASGTRQNLAGESALKFAYKKTAWAYATCNKIQVGGYSRKVLTNNTGTLSLYRPSSNKPSIPILNSVEVTNEGMLGSLVKAKINFTVWPELSNTSFGGNFDALLDAYARPGNDLRIDWGWSEGGGSANNASFQGIIHNFNWSVNTDLSVTFDVSATGKGGISTGFTGEQSNPKSSTTKQVQDAAGNIIPNSDIANMIKQDITELNKNSPPATIGPAKWTDPNTTVNTKFHYWSIPLPRGEDDSALPSTAGSSGTPTGPRPVDLIWYVPLGSIIEVLNQLIVDSKAPIPFVFQPFDVYTDRHNEIVSASPEEVFFPDSKGMGTYGTVDPFAGTSLGGQNYSFDRGNKCGNTPAIGHGAILLSTSYISSTFKKFVTENQTNLETKNFTKFIDELVKAINYASGEVYQLSTVIIEDPAGANPAKICIEDGNMPKSYTECVVPQPILASASAPLIKSVQISSKPPNTAAAAAFVAAKGGASGGSPVDVKNDKTTASQQVSEATKAMTDLKNSFLTRGYGPSFSKDMKAAQTKWKKAYGGGDAHWLNKSIFPIDLSLTIDGIEGFKFGDVITTNLIPSKLASEMVFTVTKITHSIKDGVWETTLGTKARLKM